MGYLYLMMVIEPFPMVASTSNGKTGRYHIVCSTSSSPDVDVEQAKYLRRVSLPNSGPCLLPYW